jgi:hypothetical protein
LDHILHAPPCHGRPADPPPPTHSHRRAAALLAASDTDAVREGERITGIVTRTDLMAALAR